MNTLRKNWVPFIDPSKEHIILLHDLEFGMSKSQLCRITELWNEGMSWEKIAEQEERNYYEVLIALVHQAKRGILLRPFAYRIKEGD